LKSDYLEQRSFCSALIVFKEVYEREEGRRGKEGRLEGGGRERERGRGREKREEEERHNAERIKDVI
jgi:hypothetical protein